MVFASMTFIYYFLPIFFLLYFIFRKNILIQNLILAIFSIIFYAWGEPVFVFILILSTYLNYIFGKAIKKSNYKKLILVLGIVFNVYLIFIFKYLNLISELFFAFKMIKTEFHLHLPIGISFYTFQSISYLVDVYRKDVEPQEKYLNLLLYISMFPQLIAGPIVRYKTVEKSIISRKYSIEQIYLGIERLIIGLGKKVILANQLSIVVSEFLIEDIASISVIQRTIGIIIYMIQLYFDFSGYSDIAIGIGKIIGFEFPENFNYPLLSFSMTDFWKKWHISLGTFFRDYIYIPLGGKKSHQIRNILVVWFLTGIWHGAHINFVIWGLFLAFVIIMEKTLKKVKIRLPKPICFLYFMIINVISFSIFYFTDYEKLIKFFDVMTNNVAIWDINVITLLKTNLYIIILSCVLALPIVKAVQTFFENITKNSRLLFTSYLFVKTLIYLCIFVIVTILLIGETNNPFLYMQF